MLVRRDQNRVNEIYQEIQPLQARLRGGLFGDKSLMQKVVINTLDGEQSQRWEQELAQRRRFQYEAKVEFIVAALGQSLALNAKQREQLIRVLLEETQAPVRSGAYEFYVLMHQLSKLPAARLEPLFDDAQWEAMKEQLQQAKGLEPFLKAQGILE